MLFDSHAHLNFKAFADDLSEVIKRCQQQKMLVINVGSQLPTSKRAVDIAEQNKGFFAAVGIHPIHTGGVSLDPTEAGEDKEIEKMSTEQMFAEVSGLAQNARVVAIGETGLDYYHLDSGREKVKELQTKVFLQHIALANALNKPLILHARPFKDDDVYHDLIDILKSQKDLLPFSDKKGVIHCFVGDLEIAKQFIDLGFAVGFTGIITFKTKSKDLQRVVKELPLENILIETDSPYLSPEPFRGKRNEPMFVEQVAKKIAEIKGIKVEEVIEATAKNAKEIFKII